MATSYKIRKDHLKFNIAVVLLILLNFNSCTKHCETCIRINTITMQVIDTQKACHESDIRHLESRGYQCN